jgi:hypothetical protein
MSYRKPLSYSCTSSLPSKLFNFLYNSSVPLWKFSLFRQKREKKEKKKKKRMADASNDGFLDKLEKALLPTRTLHIRDSVLLALPHNVEAGNDHNERNNGIILNIEREGTQNGTSITESKPVMANIIEEILPSTTTSPQVISNAFSPITSTLLHQSLPKIDSQKDTMKQPSQSPSNNQSKREHRDTTTSTPVSFFDNKSANNEDRSNNITPTFLKRKSREGDDEGSLDTLNSSADTLKFITSENIVRNQISKRNLTLPVAYIQTVIR